MQKQRVRLLLLTIIIILVIYFIMYRSDMMIHELDQQMPVIGFIGLGGLKLRLFRFRSFPKLFSGFVGLILITCFSQVTNAQVTVAGSGGAANGSYTTLKLAFDALNAVNTQAGNSITVAITADITDNNTAVLNQPSVSTWTSLTISPSGGSRTLSGSVNAPLVDLNGADHVIVDGLNTGGNALIISNTSTSSVTGTSTIRLINDASNNTITNCSIQGSSTGNAAQSVLGIIPVTATIIIAGTNSSAGNDNNSITNNTIAEAGTNLPTVAICSSGQSTSISNDMSVITGNNMANFYGVNGANGIAIASNSSAFTISSNKFYQTAARSGLNLSKYLECIFINTPSGGGYIINNNTIGYANANGTGMLINTNGRFAGIDVTSVAATPISEIQGNTINGINWSSNYGSSSSSDASFSGIIVRAGGVNMGTSTGNTIGALTGTGSATTNLYITNTTSLIGISMIYLSSASNCIISNNHIGAITSVPGNVYMYGITFEGSGSHTVLSNDIGSPTIGSITIGVSGGNFGQCNFRGVYCNATGNEIIGSVAQGNTIQHITFISQSFNDFEGIFINNNALSLNINYNTLHGIVYSATPGSNNSTFGGIVNYGNASNALTINYNQLGTAGSGLISYEQMVGNAQGDFYGIRSNALLPATPLSISNNDFRGITFAGTGSIFQTLIYWNHSGSVTDNINDNTFTNLNMNNIANVTFMERSGNMTSTGVENVNGNTIVTGFTKAGDGGVVTFFRGSGSSVTGSVMNNQFNNFSNVTVNGQTDIDGWVNQNGASSTNGPLKMITNNIFSNLTTASNSNATLQGMSVNYSAAGSSISSNTFQNLIGGSSVTAINLWNTNSSNGSLTISQNLICGLNSQTGSSTYGIYSQLYSAVITKNKICDLTSSNSTGFVKGIFIDSPSNSGGTHTISNNLIGNLTAPAATGNNSVIGLDMTSNISPSTYNVYYNTIYLSSTGGSGFGSSGIFHQSSAIADKGKLNLRNNIIINLSTPGAGGKSVAYRRSHGNGGDLSNYGVTSNTNLFYAGAPASDHLIYYDGVSSATTIEAYRSGVFNAGTIAPRDAQSVSQVIVPGNFFLSTTSTNPDFLHINPANATVVESGGIPIPTFTDDYDGNTRNTLTPDIGADEGTFIVSDQAGPVITYSLIQNGIVSNTQLFSSVIITDQTGVEGTAGIRPRVYYKRSTDSNTFNSNTNGTSGWKYVEASNATSPFDFTLDYTLLSGGGGVAVGNTIQYFVVAQDQIVPPNVSMVTGVFAGFPLDVALTSAAFPIAGTINSFQILQSLSGTYAVPGHFPTLTGAGGAFEFINANVVTGNINIEITANISIENGLNSLNAFTAPYTIKIYPVSGSRILSGSAASGGIIKLNGADRVTIDGSIGGTGTNRNLTIVNNSTTSPTVIALQSLGSGAGATNNTIKNCNITFGNSNITGLGISVGGVTPGTPGADNDQITIQNNYIDLASTCIYAIGMSAISAGGNDNLQITGNTITSNSSAAECIGIRVGNSLTSNISGNSVAAVSSNTIYPVGISLETGFVSSQILSNQIISVWTFGGSGFGGRGMTIGTGSTNSDLTIANNVISNITGTNNSDMTRSSMGICIGLLGSSLNTATTGGVKLYYNSVHMNGSMSTFANAITCALYVGSAASNLDIRNNIFANSQTSGVSGQKNYAIYSAASGSAFSTMNMNDYYVSNAAFPSAAIPGFLTTDRIDLPAIQTGFGQNANSIIVNPSFFGINDLRLSTGNVIGLANIAGTGITLDYLSVTRGTGAPPSGSTMGAYETMYDNVPPVIQYTTLQASCTTGDRTLTATITDGVGVPVSGTLVPRIYFKKNAGSYFSSPGVLTTGTGFNGTWTFTIVAASMGGVTGGDVISYFITAQDMATPLNISASPGNNFVASNVNSVSTPPNNPNTYTVLLTFVTGNYSVGSGSIAGQLGHFQSLTAALQAYSVSCLAGAPVFVLTDANYSAESFPLTINQHAQASNVNILTIKPAPGVNPVITGFASTALIDLNGADYIIIDGSNSGGNTKNLTISNTSGSGAVIRFINDATNNVIKNSILKGVNTGSSAVVYFATTNLTTGNDFNLIQNNDITSGTSPTAFGILNSGNGGPSAAKNSGIQIVGNNIYNFTNTAIWDNGGSVGTVYLNNQIYELTNQPTGQLIGFSCTSNTIEGFVFRGNRIYDMKLLGSNIYGINITGLATGSANVGEISNNMIAFSPTNNVNIQAISDYCPSGTYLKINFNTVSISGDMIGFTAGYYRSSTSITEFKNNIISNTKTNSGADYGIYLYGAGTLANFTSDYNNSSCQGNWVAKEGGFEYTNLASWISATNQDQHSLSGESLFQSTTDLHLLPEGNCGVDGKGISIPGFSTDYDGASRMSPPDIGADEFTGVPFTGVFPAGPDQVLCASTATMAATPASPGMTGTWSIITGSGTFQPNANNPVAIVSGLAPGLNKFKWTVNFGSCLALDTVVITNNSVTITEYPSYVSVIANPCTAIANYSTTVVGSPIPTLTYAFSGATTGSGTGNGSGSVFNIGVTTVTLTASNGCGSNAVRSFPMEVLAPVIEVLGNNVILMDGQLSYSINNFTDFDTVMIDTMRTHTFFVHNIGTYALSPGTITVTGIDASKFTVSQITGSIAPGDNASFTLTFTPLTNGLKTATIHIASNDCLIPDFDFAVRGYGHNRYHFIGSGDWTETAKWYPSYPGLIVKAGIEAYADDLEALYIPSNINITINGDLNIPYYISVSANIIVGSQGSFSVSFMELTDTLLVQPGGHFTVNNAGLYIYNYPDGALLNHGIVNINNAEFSNESMVYNYPGATLISNYITTNGALFENHGIFIANGTLAGWIQNMPDGTMKIAEPDQCLYNYDQLTTQGTLELNINGTTNNCTLFDRIYGIGYLELAGTLKLNINYTPSNNDAITILEGGLLINQFAVLDAPPGWTIHYNDPQPNKITVKFNCTGTMITSQPIATQTDCQNTPPSILSVSASGTGLQYQWYVDGDNLDFNGSSIMGATSSTYMPPTTIPGTNYYYASIIGACGTINTQYAEVNVNATGRWLGTVSSDWHTASNWCGGVPDMATDVIIAPAPFHPIVSTANAICHHLTLLPTAVLDINAPRELRVKVN